MAEISPTSRTRFHLREMSNYVIQSAGNWRNLSFSFGIQENLIAGRNFHWREERKLNEAWRSRKELFVRFAGENNRFVAGNNISPGRRNNEQGTLDVPPVMRFYAGCAHYRIFVRTRNEQKPEGSLYGERLGMLGKNISSGGRS